MPAHLAVQVQRVIHELVGQPRLLRDPAWGDQIAYAVRLHVHALDVALAHEPLQVDVRQTKRDAQLGRQASLGDAGILLHRLEQTEIAVPFDVELSFGHTPVVPAQTATAARASAKTTARTDPRTDEKTLWQGRRSRARGPRSRAARGRRQRWARCASRGYRPRSSQAISRSFAMALLATRPTTSCSCRAGMPVPGRFAQTSSVRIVAPAAMSRIDTTL